MSDIATRVQHIIAKQLDVDPEKIKPESSFTSDFGADSLDLVELVMALEDEFGIEIPDHAAEKITKVSDAVNYITENADKAA